MSISCIRRAGRWKAEERDFTFSDLLNKPLKTSIFQIIKMKSCFLLLIAAAFAAEERILAEPFKVQLPYLGPISSQRLQKSVPLS
jgi:hypothetical protein